ncbi:MAG: hypothetical protein LIO96_11350 [Lachnospiraceae bacterium]|nr:hypothetical protein [Lachnospiraceae bacterium]
MNDTQTKQPILDTLIQSRDLQMLKAMVPYFDSSRQRTISMVIRLAELQKTMLLFRAEPELQAAELHICENESPMERTQHMLQAMKEFCTPGEAETIENISGFFEMYASYESMTREGLYDTQ